MPPKAKINRQKIIDAAFQVIRIQGHEHLNARTIAQELHCSTQPVMYYFKTVEEIRLEAYRKADAFHSDYISSKGERNCSPLLELGLNYIQFGYAEKNLFRFLFQTNSFDGKTMTNLIAAPEGEAMIGMVSEVMGCSMEEARMAFFNLYISAHGMASLLANNAMVYEEDTVRAVLENAYRKSNHRV